MKNENLNNQYSHWEETLSNKPQMFGTNPSESAIKAVKIFKENGFKKILEANSFKTIKIDHFEEGALPRKLFFVVQKKSND